MCNNKYATQCVLIFVIVQRLSVFPLGHIVIRFRIRRAEAQSVTSVAAPFTEVPWTHQSSFSWTEGSNCQHGAECCYGAAPELCPTVSLRHRTTFVFSCFCRRRSQRIKPPVVTRRAESALQPPLKREDSLVMIRSAALKRCIVGGPAVKLAVTATPCAPEGNCTTAEDAINILFNLVCCQCLYCN